MHANADIRDPDAAAATQTAPVVESVYFVFRLGGLVYALPPGVVESVAPEQRPVPVPTSPPHVRGAIYLRGRIAALVDLSRLLRLEAAGAAVSREEQRRVVLLDVQGVVFAFTADEALGLWTHPGRAARADAADRPVVGRFEQAETQVAVLDPVALLRMVTGGAGGEPLADGSEA